MKNEIVLFENQDVKLEVNVKDETVWLTQAQMAQLFDRDVKTISKHPIKRHITYYVSFWINGCCKRFINLLRFI